VEKDVDGNSPFLFPAIVVGAGSAGLYAASHYAYQGAQAALQPIGSRQ